MSGSHLWVHGVQLLAAPAGDTSRVYEHLIDSTPGRQAGRQMLASSRDRKKRSRNHMNQLHREKHILYVRFC